MTKAQWQEYLTIMNSLLAEQAGRALPTPADVEAEFKSHANDAAKKERFVLELNVRTAHLYGLNPDDVRRANADYLATKAKYGTGKP